ncbi:MAG: Maf family protein [Clostridiales bacterium]|nr:Maf family protein [Clostridiales bacterium]
MKNCNLVLASASPRRKEILEKHGINPIIIPSLNPEILPEGLKVTGLPECEQEKVDRGSVEYLAMTKATSVAKDILKTKYCIEHLTLEDDVNQSSAMEADRISAVRKAADILKRGGSLVILGADTLVFKGEKFGKPKNAQEAFQMLRALRGSSHKVITGVAVLLLEGAEKNEAIGSDPWVADNFSCETIVKFAEVQDEEIEYYVGTDEPYDKAGGYAIQGYFGRYVEGYEGDFENVIGLPYRMIEERLSDIMGEAKLQKCWKNGILSDD